MATIRIELPSVLEDVMPGQRSLELEAATLDQALQVLTQEHPVLKVHLFDETGGFRQHVLCFHNGTNTRWLDDLAVPLADGDTVQFLQAVSGG